MRGGAADRLRLLGPTHPQTYDSRYRLAWLYGMEGRPDASLAAFEALLVDLVRVRGRRHLATLRCRGALIPALRHSGRLAEAEVEARALLSYERELGVVQSYDVSARDELELLRRMRH